MQRYYSFIQCTGLFVNVLHAHLTALLHTSRYRATCRWRALLITHLIMKYTFLAGVLTVALISVGGVSYAQTSSQTQNLVTVTTTAASTTPSAGSSGAVLGSVTLSASQSGQFGNVALSSIPLSLTTSGGATASNLTSCQLYNANGTALTTGANIIGTASGTNTFTFDSPLMVQGGQTTTLQVRCNVASGSPSSGTYQFSAGMPIMSAGLMATLNASPSVRVGAQDTLIALMSLSAQRSGSPIQVASLPLTVSFMNGAQAGNISDCRVRNLTNLVAPLNNGGNAIGIVQGSNSIPLDTPLQINAGSMMTIAFTCDIASNVPLGGQISLALTPGSIPATVVGSNATVTPTTGFGTNNQPGVTSGTVVFTSVSAPTSPTQPTVPGVPNTGSNSSSTLSLLLATGFLALAGMYMARRLRRV